MVIQVQDKSKKLRVRASKYMRPDGFVLESSAASFENETKRLPCPSFGEVFLQHHFTATSPMFLQHHFYGLK